MKVPLKLRAILGPYTRVGRGGEWAAKTQAKVRKQTHKKLRRYIKKSINEDS